ncbi:hypothetical protein [Effusibacillus dendaii]|uniref:Uncharacterized protein n=1 Tax=Effusibacillus dendaii TaxID=2743772 RepID=A0A7I8D942_9BACL|nr:hypothetical protein [Effusibacillus dendaii]BCJ86663.1 hypothetical protein skT53_16480 [Effusibacillus dendaii]
MKNRAQRFSNLARWMIVFLVIFVLLMLFLSGGVGTAGLFGLYTPWVVAFLIIYILLMLFVNGFFSKIKKSRV